MFKTGAQMLLIVLLAGAFLLRESRQWPCSVLEEGFCDWLSLNGPGPTHPNPAPLTLVAINDNSVSDHPWPWTPLDFSLFAQATQAFQPEVTAYGEILDWDQPPGAQSERQRQFENILRDTLLRSSKVLLAARLGWPDDPEVIPPLQEVALIKKISGDLRPIPDWPAIERQPKEEYRLPAALGFVNIPSGSVPLRSVPLVLRYRGEVVPSFVLQAVVLWQKLSLDDVSVHLGSHVAIGDKLRIPIDAAGQMRVNFGAQLITIGFDELLLANEQAAAKQQPSVPVERLRGGIALLARTDAPSRTLPLGSGRNGSQGELLAAAIATIQKQAFSRRISDWFDLAVIAAVSLASLWIPRRKKLTIVTVSLITLIVYGLVAMALFASERIWIPLVLPVGLVLFAMAYRLATSNAECPAATAPRPVPETKPPDAKPPDANPPDAKPAAGKGEAEKP